MNYAKASRVFLDEIFSREEPIYFSHEDMTNYEAMAHYLETNDLSSYVIVDDQSLVYLFHPSTREVLSLHISGMGDFFNSVIELNKENPNDFIQEIRNWEEVN